MRPGAGALASARPPMQAHDRLDDGQAETAGLGVAARGVATVETVEQARQRFGRQPVAGVLHAQQEFPDRRRPRTSIRLSALA